MGNFTGLDKLSSKIGDTLRVELSLSTESPRANSVNVFLLGEAEVKAIEKAAAALATDPGDADAIAALAATEETGVKKPSLMFPFDNATLKRAGVAPRKATKEHEVEEGGVEATVSAIAYVVDNAET